MNTMERSSSLNDVKNNKIKNKRARHMTVSYPKELTKEMILEILEEQTSFLNENNIQEMVASHDIEEINFQNETEEEVENIIYQRSINLIGKNPTEEHMTMKYPVGQLLKAVNHTRNIRPIPSPEEYPFNIISNQVIDAKTTAKSLLWGLGTCFLNELLDEGVFDISRSGLAHIVHVSVIATLFRGNIIENSKLVIQSKIAQPIKQSFERLQEESPLHVAFGTILMGLNDIMDSGGTSDTLLGIGCVAGSLIFNRVRQNALRTNVKNKPQVRTNNTTDER